MKVVEMTCPGCGAQMKLVPGSRYAVCEYCDTEVYLEAEHAQKKQGPQERQSVMPVRETAPGQGKQADRYYTGSDTGTHTYDSGSYDQQFNQTYQNQQVVHKGMEPAAHRTLLKRWFIAVAVLLFLTGWIPALSTLGGAVLFIGGFYVFLNRPRTENVYAPTSSAGMPIRYPWYLTIWGIILLGFLTCSIYWFIGPFLRMYHAKKRR